MIANLNGVLCANQKSEIPMLPGGALWKIFRARQIFSNAAQLALGIHLCDFFRLLGPLASEKLPNGSEDLIRRFYPGEMRASLDSKKPGLWQQESPLASRTIWNDPIG